MASEYVCQEFLVEPPARASVGGDTSENQADFTHMRRWCLKVPLGIVLASLISGCMTTPPLSHATNNLPFSKNISTHDIVQRIKCELADAFDKKTADPNFRWMASWTAKVDLTLQTNESGGITPNATFIKPFNNVSIPNEGTFPQNLNFGIGATFSGQAYRTETLSFSLALAELKTWREGKAAFLDCKPAGETDLEGDLDLAPWIDAALEPARAGDLELGIHPAPGSGAPKAPSAGQNLKAAGKPAPQAPYYIAVAMDEAKQATASAESANAAKRQAMHAHIRSQKIIDKIADLANLASHQAIEAQKAYTNIKNINDDLSLETLVENATKAAENAEAAAQNAALAQRLANPDPPIDSISHSLNFIVVVGGSVSPNWTLLNWKGPATTGSFASYSGIRTHTLTVALGSPTTITNTETARVLANQAFRQAIQSP